MTGQSLRLRGAQLEWVRGTPLLMGIVNTGSDSFSDTGPPPTTESSVARGLQLVEEGASIIDVGGESGVTYTPESAVQDEIARVVPVVSELAAAGAVVSVDTYKPAVAEAALEAGAHLINDVSGLLDLDLARVTAEAGAGLVVMHTRGAPKQEHFPEYEDVVEDVFGFLAERAALAIELGVSPDSLIVDPGPDFTKSPEETIAVLRATDRFSQLDFPWLAAISRKYFQAAIVPRPPQARGALTLASLGFAADAGAAIARVHDVAAAADYLAARDVLAGRKDPVPVDRDDERLKWTKRA